MQKNKNILNQTGELFEFLAKHLFLSAILMFFLALMVTSFLINYYPAIIGSNYQSASFSFNEKKYQDILSVWQNQDKNNQDINSKVYTNLFYENIKVLDK